MHEAYDVPLAELTTFRVGGPAKRLLTVDDRDTLVETVRSCEAAGEPVLVLGGGSNLLVGDEGFPGTVVRIATTGVHVESVDGSRATVRVAAGEHWDGFVARAVAEGWVGIEALSGIPGLVGAAPIQNVGAYGQEVAQTLVSVRVWDRTDSAVTTLPLAECGFGYRTSRFKRDPSRYVVLEVGFQFGAPGSSPGKRSEVGGPGAPVRYAELARVLGVELGERAPMPDVREAVLGLRRGKGMVLDADDHDTWSAGSFFTNPVLPAADADRLPTAAPRWPQPDGTTKTSAAWLIEHAGFGKGYGDGPARLSSKHTLALTNRGRASAADLLALAREVRDGVRAAFGVQLVPEPVLVGCTL